MSADMRIIELLEQIYVEGAMQRRASVSLRDVMQILMNKVMVFDERQDRASEAARMGAQLHEIAAHCLSLLILGCEREHAEVLCQSVNRQAKAVSELHAQYLQDLGIDIAQQVRVALRTI